MTTATDPRALKFAAQMRQLRQEIRRCLNTSPPPSWTLEEHRMILDTLEAIQRGREDARKPRDGGATVIHMPARLYDKPEVK